MAIKFVWWLSPSGTSQREKRSLWTTASSSGEKTWDFAAVFHPHKLNVTLKWRTTGKSKRRRSLSLRLSHVRSPHGLSLPPPLPYHTLMPVARSRTRRTQPHKNKPLCSGGGAGELLQEKTPPIGHRPVLHLIPLLRTWFLHPHLQPSLCSKLLFEPRAAPARARPKPASSAVAISAPSAVTWTSITPTSPTCARPWWRVTRRRLDHRLISHHRENPH